MILRGGKAPFREQKTPNPKWDILHPEAEAETAWFQGKQPLIRKKTMAAATSAPAAVPPFPDPKCATKWTAYRGFLK